MSSSKPEIPFAACARREVAIAELSILRSQNRDINLTLLEPTYTAREGVLEVINTALKELRITSLSIVARDFGFVRQLLDPRLNHELKPSPDYEEELLRMIGLCFSKDADPSMLRMPPTTFWEMEERAVMSALIKRMDEERDALAKNLHTLRIEQSASIRLSWWCDRRRCILPPGKYPALRRVEIKTFQRLPLFALPYPQLTHLKLVTQERESILLGIVKGCKALECLAIALPQQRDTTPGPISFVHTGLRELHITIGSTNTGRFFIDGIQTPSLSILEINSHADCSGPVKHLMQRLKCSLTNFTSTSTSQGRDVYEASTDTPADNLLETLETVSNSLVDLMFKSRFKDLAWLEGLKPRGLRTGNPGPHLRIVDAGDKEGLGAKDLDVLEHNWFKSHVQVIILGMEGIARAKN
ncbi:hypothetical protein DFP72DRAFT_854821 [Ephemerocybe angulata]|uniref:Uncharacterized protein n=1 Tax=Ephemerocybe angulata TaxID=980116 RepID=A0A8H6HJP6_9AGAR|nr:hypothetical protein DFP72DRAFT_854821 [Tulosesus angulatus]